MRSVTLAPLTTTMKNEGPTPGTVPAPKVRRKGHNVIEVSSTAATASVAAYKGPDSRTAVIVGQRRQERRASRLPVHTLPASDAATLRALAATTNNLSGEGQCALLLRALKAVACVSVDDLHEVLCIGHAPRRVADLKAAGHLIHSEPVARLDRLGRARKTVVYRLYEGAAL